ncbi:SEC-C metal-binding domain-containing protein [Motilimonas sp. 1_MG-2023]|uniref:YecA family protein n=1 Tax=Motilimonas sp. 1_MG-2023 TaxID=3062672 RepID=UPI0026E45C53|nr:SEC-C metal-binding domain-containing protein [Motilimonas sp. 1_MG-2023]MDO6526101.1 SEC-C metal-binding domain-containing protein [Motilimonas sp. 1_MG-2023]
MKISRNDPCPCGSSTIYQRCCMNNAAKQQADVFDDIAQTVAMNPNLTLDELSRVVQRKMAQRNNQPHTDFCGLSPTQMANWLYAPFNELIGVTINTPVDLSSCPVMRYLALILDEAVQQGGSFKATSKGNLPTKLVKQASGLLPEFAVAEYELEPSISDYMGSNEDKFIALHYTRVLAEIAGIIYRRNGRFQIKKTAQKQYQSHGLSIFFQPMLEAAITQYNWGYLDSWQDNVDLRTFWLFMLWRLQSHGSIDQLIAEVCIAFPDLVSQFPRDTYDTSQQHLSMRIEARFINHFLQFWGFITVDPKRYANKKRLPRKANIQLLLTQTFEFSI